MNPQELGASKLPSLLSAEKEMRQGSGRKCPTGQVSVDGPGEAAAFSFLLPPPSPKCSPSDITMQ